ncbi:PHP domain-containing protein [Tepidiforma sp.]|jgi:predicted metal-dependent phosphoesterase TrpH|uniref:PHP domain-containing protein n=1 Tax=Tepidiforma sp. TaxID=2682230 RepID=UPI00260A3526|nr:PHP domain-containing protein [Tepidiforma sp.]MCX7617441.1 PHP domain-containing protein [Tepidiforma sp.]
MAIGDFHLHSTASDGVQTPTWVMERAAANGVQVLSLTDHDTTDGLEEAAAAARRLGLRLIPGVEISTEVGKADVHLLGFGFDPSGPRLQEFFRWQREGRLARVEKIVGILRDHGMPLETQRVLEIAGEATVGRPHVARALVEKGYVASVQEAFDLWLGNGKPADVNREKLDPQDAIAIIHEHGGVVFVAHPVFIGENYVDVIRMLRGLGADGIETYYKHYLPETVARHAALAQELGMAASGGSDFHGLGNPDDRDIGDIPFPDERVREFVEFIDANCACGAIEV